MQILYILFEQRTCSIYTACYHCYDAEKSVRCAHSTTYKPIPHRWASYLFIQDHSNAYCGQRRGRAVLLTNTSVLFPVTSFVGTNRDTELTIPISTRIIINLPQRRLSIINLCALSKRILTIWLYLCTFLWLLRRLLWQEIALVSEIDHIYITSSLYFVSFNIACVTGARKHRHSCYLYGILCMRTEKYMLKARYKIIYWVAYVPDNISTYHIHKWTDICLIKMIPTFLIDDIDIGLLWLCDLKTFA